MTGKLENGNAREYLNVKVWSGWRYFIPHSPNVVIRNLVYETTTATTSTKETTTVTTPLIPITGGSKLDTPGEKSDGMYSR